MTIKALIEKLQAFPADMRVVVAGYETGFNDISQIEIVGMIPDVKTKWWDGQHEDPMRDEDGTENALLLGGENLIAKN